MTFRHEGRYGASPLHLLAHLIAAAAGRAARCCRSLDARATRRGSCLARRRASSCTTWCCCRSTGCSTGVEQRAAGRRGQLRARARWLSRLLLLVFFPVDLAARARAPSTASAAWTTTATSRAGCWSPRRCSRSRVRPTCVRGAQELNDARSRPVTDTPSLVDGDGATAGAARRSRQAPDPAPGASARASRFAPASVTHSRRRPRRGRSPTVRPPGRSGARARARRGVWKTSSEPPTESVT